MNNEEMEEIVAKLNQRVNKNDQNFLIDKKTKDIFKRLNFFHQIMKKYPDKGDSIITSIISNIYIRKYNQFEIIWDDSKKFINGIFIILQGIVNVYKYNYQHKSKSNEIKLNVSLKKVKKSKDYVNKPLEFKIPGLKTKNNLIIDDLKPVQIDFVAKKGDSIGNSFLINIEQSIKNKVGFKTQETFNEENKEHKKFYKLESKTKSIIAFLTEEDYNSILEKIIIKERHERINFLHNIHYMPRDQAFIERFQNYLTKRCFSKHSTIFKQNDEFRTFYIIVSGNVRISINFNRQFFCSLDFDVLIGNHINDRFTSSRLYEIIGNYREKENFIVVDLGKGEILGGIEFYKKINKYIFNSYCITDVILYEINNQLFNNIITYWNFQRFYTKIENQFNYFINRVLDINKFRKEKFKKDDYSSEQNKFIITYKRGHPISEKKEGYIKRFTNPYNFEKIFKSKELKVNNTRYIKDFHKNQIRNEIKKENIINKMPFITNIPKNAKKFRKPKKSKTMIDFKYQKNKFAEEIEDINKEKKESDIKNHKEESKKILKLRNVLKHSNSTLSINTNDNKKIRRFHKRRLNSCKIENNIKAKINYNFYENKIAKSNNYITKSISNISIKNKGNKNSENLLKADYLNYRKKENNLYKSYDKKFIKKRKKNFMNNNLTEESNNNISNNLKIAFSINKDYIIYNKILIQMNKESRNISHPYINYKNVLFPSGVKESDNEKIINIKELLPSFISNSYIRNELKLKKMPNISPFFPQNNN